MPLTERPARAAASTTGRLLGSLALALLLVLAAVGAGVLKISNPFGATTKDTSGPALMKALDDLHDFHGATAQYQQVVDVDQGYRFVPHVIAGRDTTFLATGSVDGIVSFDGLGPNAVHVQGKDVTITLPAPHLGPARLDAEQSKVLSRDRGVVTRVADALGDGATDTAYWKAGQEKIQKAAAVDPTILQRTQDNTRQTLQKIASSLGYSTVTVTFTPTPSP